MYGNLRLFWHFQRKGKACATFYQDICKEITGLQKMYLKNLFFLITLMLTSRCDKVVTL